MATVKESETVCAECGMPGQCAACYLMESQGVRPHSADQVAPPPPGRPVERTSGHEEDERE